MKCPKESEQHFLKEEKRKKQEMKKKEKHD